MSEAITSNGYDGYEDVRQLSDIEFLHGLGFSFISSAKAAKRRSSDRMADFDKYDDIDIAQRNARIIDVAYYALELSTPLSRFSETLSAVEKLEPEQRDASQALVDKLHVALKVDEMLSLAHSETSSYSPEQLSELKKITANYNWENTGCLAALRKMTAPSAKLGHISMVTARHSENLLRLSIAKEKSLVSPL